MRHPGDDDATAPTRLLILAWAFAVLYHQVAYREPFASPLGAVVTVLAAWLLVRPVIPVLVVMAAAQCLLVGQQLPAVYNHWYVVALVNLGIVLAAVSARVRGRHADSTESRRSEFLPAARLFLVVLYFLTGWHKLNRDFLTPGVSCASVLLDQLATRLGGVIFPPAVDTMAIVFTLLVELGVPIALLSVRTRRPALLVALLFHAAMAVSGYARFSAVGVALLLCFLAPATQRRILAPPLLGTPRHRAVLVAGLLLSAMVGPIAEMTFLVGQLAFTVWIAWVVVRDGTAATMRTPLLEPAGAWLPFAAPILLLLSGIAPYVGLQTDRTVAMYSNLRTEGGTTNHLLVPSAWQRFDYQRDLVTVVEIAGQPLGPSVTIPYEELRARATEALARTVGLVPLRYRRGDVEYRVPDARLDAVLALPVSRLHRKLLRFRLVEARGPRQCSV